jgi:hypothetical protein
MRFLLPTFFLYAVASVWLLRLLARRVCVRTSVLTGTLLVLQAWWGLPRSVQAMSKLQRLSMPLAELADVLQDTIPRGSLLIAPAAVNQLLSSVGTWRLVDISVLWPGRQKRLSLRDGGGQPDEEGVVPSPGSFGASQPEEGPVMEQPRSSLREPRPIPKLFHAFRREVWRWAGGRRVYWLMNRADFLSGYFEALLPRGDSFRVDSGGSGSRAPTSQEKQVVVEWVRSGQPSAAPAVRNSVPPAPAEPPIPQAPARSSRKELLKSFTP